MSLTRLVSGRLRVATFSTFTPLIASGIFYAANGENHIDYIDALFNCLSACVVCGLATVDLSALTGFQQALLFFLMSIGNPVSPHISFVMKLRLLKASNDCLGSCVVGHCVHTEVRCRRPLFTSLLV